MMEVDARGGKGGEVGVASRSQTPALHSRKGSELQVWEDAEEMGGPYM